MRILNVLGVMVVLALGILHCLYSLYVANRRKRVVCCTEEPKGHDRPQMIAKRQWYSFPTDEVSQVATSPFLPQWLLGCCRLAASAYIFTVGWFQLLHLPYYNLPRKALVLSYTVWNWWLLGSYFLLAGTVSLTAPKGALATGMRGWLIRRMAHAAAVLHHINTTSVLIVVLVFWIILVPFALSTRDEEMLAFWRKLLLNFYSYNQHGANALMMLLDNTVSHIPFQYSKFGYVGLWQLLYTALAVYWHVAHGGWCYPFLSTRGIFAPFAYACMYASLWMYFIALWGVDKCKVAVVSAAKTLTSSEVVLEGLVNLWLLTVQLVDSVQRARLRRKRPPLVLREAELVGFAFRLKRQAMVVGLGVTGLGKSRPLVTVVPQASMGAA